MIISRYYAEQDKPQIVALHAKQGLAYELPDIETPSMLGRLVIEEDGEITQALFMQKTCELFWLFNPEVSRASRLKRLLILNREGSALASRLGFAEAHCWLPPEISSDKRTDRTLLRLGWRRPLWTSYAHTIGESRG